MKHVWILNHYAQAPGGAGSTRHYSLARHLPAHGWKATIIAASVDHPTGAQRLTEAETSRFDTLDGIGFLWVRTRDYAGNGFDRIGNMLDYTWAVLRRGAVAGLDPPDVIIGSSVHPLAAWAGRRLAKRFRVPFLFEVRDLWPQTLIDMGRLTPNHPAAICLRWLEKSLYRSAARTIVLLPHAKDYIEPLGIEPGRIVWIPNGVDLGAFPKAGIAPQTGVFTLMYFGAHGQANDIGNMLAAMQLIEKEPNNKSIVLRLIGNGPMKSKLIGEAQAMGLSGVYFEDPVARSEIPRLAVDADAFVISVRNLPGLYRFGIGMNKIFDYLAANRPTIIGVDASNNPIADAGAGLTVPPENPVALAQAIVSLASLPPDRRHEMGTAGRRYVEANHDMGLLAQRLAVTLDEAMAAK